jgi:hypothetical protein
VNRFGPNFIAAVSTKGISQGGPQSLTDGLPAAPSRKELTLQTGSRLLVIAGALRLLHGGPLNHLMDLDLQSPDHRTVAPYVSSFDALNSGFIAVQTNELRRSRELIALQEDTYR